MTVPGHNNPPTFDDDIAAVLSAGTLVVAWDRVKLAVHDPRLKRRHLCVLVELLDCMNATAGTAWPSREVLARRCDLAVKVVENVLYELRALHYVSWERRAGPTGGRRLFHYTVPLSASATLKAELERHLEGLRAKTETALSDLDQAIWRAKLPPPLVEKKSNPVGGKIKTPSPLMENSPPPSMEKSPPPLIGQELTKEPTKEKNISLGADAPASEFVLVAPKEPMSAGEKLFDEFWAAYPRKEAKGKARDVFIAIIKGKRKDQGARAETIISAAKEFASRRRCQDPKFTPYPASWLNQSRWDDEPDDAAPTSASDEARKRFAAIVGGDK